MAADSQDVRAEARDEAARVARQVARETTNEQMQAIASQTAKCTVDRTLTTLGIPVEDPREMQATMSLMRRLAKARETGSTALIWALITVVVSGALAGVWRAVTGG